MRRGVRRLRNLWLVALLLLSTPLLAQGSPPTTPVTFNPTRAWLTDVALGNVSNYQILHKFGSGVATTTIAPVSQSGVYRTPTTAQALEFVSDSANDTAAGTGAREITVIGLDASWAEVTQVVATNGLTAVPIPTNLIRLYRWYVSASGTYADQTTASHDGTLTIRAAGGGDTWSTIPLVEGVFGSGQSRIGVLTVPAGTSAYILGYSVTVDSAKAVDVYLFRRCNADDVVAPYSGTVRILRELIGLTGPYSPAFDPGPEGPFVGPCDLGFMAAVVSTSADVSVSFDLLYYTPPP